jgi:hypothetical protein
MDRRMNRFKLCDFRFLPYLRSVIERLPEKIREIVLNDKSFQILTDDEILEACVLRYDFGAPIRTLVYLNTKILKEPDHRIIHTIASEIAHYIIRKQGTPGLEGQLDIFLNEWGFGKEVEAVRYEQAISESAGYKIGYDWAKKQNHDYLMQHFGLYFDQWNDRGIGSLSTTEFDRLAGNGEVDPVLEDILPSNKLGFLDSDIAKIPESLSTRKTMLAGILTAVKEASFKKKKIQIHN